MATTTRSLSLARRLGSLRRFYHSYDHPAAATPFSPTEDAILSAAIAHVPKYGFTDASLKLGAREAGYLDASTNLFPDPPTSLVLYHLHNQRRALAEWSSAQAWQDCEHVAIAARVRALTWRRLLGNVQVNHRWQEAVAILATPSNLSRSVHELATLSDEIWFLSGDTAVDTSWYTKRALLSAIYASSELFMTTDHSLDFVHTREFLRRRFDDNLIWGLKASNITQWLTFTSGAFINVLRSKGVRV